MPVLTMAEGNAEQRVTHFCISAFPWALKSVPFESLSLYSLLGQAATTSRGLTFTAHNSPALVSDRCVDGPV